VSFLRTSLVALAFASLSVLGCGTVDVLDTGETDGLSQEIQVTRMPPTSTHYIARLDTRRCAFPTCGGIYVSAVNQTVTQCPRGSYADECYISSLDFSLFDGSEKDAVQIQDALGYDLESTRVVLQGTLQASILGSGVLRVQMAWIATDSQPVFGSFYNTHVNGLVCVAAPCPSYDQELLNRGQVLPFHGFDFDAVPAHATDGTYTVPALNSLEGLIVAGENVTVEHAGPAGEALFLKASQVFIPVALSRRSFRPMPQVPRVPVAPSDR